MIKQNECYCFVLDFVLYKLSNHIQRAARCGYPLKVVFGINFWMMMDDNDD